MVATTQAFKNLPLGLEIPDGDLVIFTGPNNSGKSALLQYMNMYSSIRERCDYVSPRRFDLSNEVAIALNFKNEILSAWNQRKSYSESTAEFSAPDAIRELVSLPNAARDRIVDWHNRYFGELRIEKADPGNDFSPPRITIDGRLATQQGSGSRAVLGVLCALLHPDRSVLLIDEPEIGVEPQVQKRLMGLIRKVAGGKDDLPKKQVYIATHSHIFLDKECLTNNWIVTKTSEGIATLTQVKTFAQLHTLIYRLLGNSPDDLLFPDNILIVEGVSDEIFWRRVLGLANATGIAVHYSDGDALIGAAASSVDQMLKTLSYIPWYREHLCIAVDASVSDTQINEWRAFLKDDGSRVRRLQRNGIEYYYPASLLRSLSGLAENELDVARENFLESLRKGARTASLGSFTGSKRDLALKVEQLLDRPHMAELDSEIVGILNAAKEARFSGENLGADTLTHGDDKL